MLAKRHNIDLSAFFDGVRNSAGNSYVFETEVPLIYNGTYDPGFTIDLHCKVKFIFIFFFVRKKIMAPLSWNLKVL